MYYSNVEIEYVATSFSPTRTDLALKLLNSSVVRSMSSMRALSYYFFVVCGWIWLGPVFPLFKHCLESGWMLPAVVTMVGGRQEDAWAIRFYSGSGCWMLIISNSYINSSIVSVWVLLLDNLLVKLVLLDSFYSKKNTLTRTHWQIWHSLVIWGQCGYYKMMPWWHCWGCRPPLTALRIHIGCLKSVWATSFAVNMHMGAPSLHCYTGKVGPDFGKLGSMWLLWNDGMMTLLRL